MLVLPLFCSRLAAATVSFSAVSDTSMFEAKPDSDLGGTTLVAGTNQQYSRSRALFRFDLSTLPADAVVTGVEVSLYVTRKPDPDQHSGPANSDFNLHRLFVSWGEGNGSNVTGSTALPGDATWNERHYGTSSWGTPGGLIGVDYQETASATTAIGDVGGYLWSSTPELLADVTAWQNDPSSNFGFILVSQGEAALGSARRFGAREQPGGQTPAAQLIVTYTVVPEPAAAGLWLIGMAGFVFLRKRRA